MQHPFGALTQYFRLIRLRKFRGQQPTGPAGDGETRVVSAKCLMSLNGHLLRPRGTSPPGFFHKIHCRAVYIELEDLTVLKPSSDLLNNNKTSSPMGNDPSPWKSLLLTNEEDPFKNEGARVVTTDLPL